MQPFRKCFFVFLLLFGYGLYAQDLDLYSKSKINTLKGLDSIFVVIDLQTTDLENEYFDSYRAKTIIELKLREYGINVISEINALNPRAGALVSNLKILKAAFENGTIAYYVYSLKLHAFQGAALFRDKTNKFLAKTWEAREVLGSSFPEKIRVTVEEGIRVQVDEFINHYFTANPKE